MTITSCATSTKRRVRYPAVAVRSAVSAIPLRAPCVEIKYSNTSRPSLYELRTGNSNVSPVAPAIRPFIPVICTTTDSLPRALEYTMEYTGPSLSKPARTTSVISSFALFQISIVRFLRSSFVKSPMLKLSLTSSTFFCASARIAFFSTGTARSSMPQLIPESVTFLKPRFFTRSINAAVSSCPTVSIIFATASFNSFFVIS